MKVVVIGAGPGGYSAALYAAKKNHEVVLIEKDKIGGTCLHRGCIPTKSFLKDSEFIATSYLVKESGLFENICQYNGKVIVKNKDNVVNNLYQGLQKLIANHNIEVIEDEASFVDEHTIVLKNKKVTLHADYFILATGSKPKLLPFAQF